MKEIAFTKYHTDVLRIFFCLTVAICHIFFLTYQYHIFHNYGVPAFFFISGYITYISLKKSGFKNFISKRIFFLCTPYFICIIFYLMYFNIFHEQIVASLEEIIHKQLPVITPLQNFINIVTHLFFIHNLFGITSQSISPNLWFMGALLQLYLLSPLLVYLVNKKILIVLLLFVIYFSASIMFIKPDLDIGGGTNISCIVPFFLGQIFAKYNSQILHFASKSFSKHIAIKYSYVTLILIANFIVINPIIQSIALNGILIFVSMPFFIMLINSAHKFIKPKLVSKIVPLTYFIYLYNCTNIATFHLTNSGFIDSILAFIVIIFFAYAFYKLDTLLRKVPRKSKKAINYFYSFVLSGKIK